MLSIVPATWGFEMSEMGDWDAESASGRIPTGGAPAPQEVPPPDAVTFLAAPRPTVPLADAPLYRPGALVAVFLLIPPVASALVLATLAWSLGDAPAWLPLTLLLWLPILLAGWAMLRSVRLTREEIAFGRPLRAWRVIPLDAIERLEIGGPLITLKTASGQRISFMPALLSRGAQLKRRLLLSLPLRALTGQARAEAQRLVGAAEIPDSDVADALTVRPRQWLVSLTGGLTLACALAAGALVIWEPALLWVTLSVGALATLSLAVCLWLAQELFIGDRGIIARFTLMRITRSVAWDDLIAFECAPGEIALVLHGPRAFICAGPRLLNERDARRMREMLNRFALEHGTPVPLRFRR
jgi:hypothetical protein